MRSDLRNFTSEEDKLTQIPLVYQPSSKQFPCEIGKFLIRKLTYAPYGLDACKELMYPYDAHDLQKIQRSLNEGVITNNPDILNKNVSALSEILDNIWNDKTISR